MLAFVVCLVSGVADADAPVPTDISTADLTRACAVSPDPGPLPGSPPGPACITIANADGPPGGAGDQTGQPRREPSLVGQPSELNANSANPSGSPALSANALSIHRGLWGVFNNEKGAAAGFGPVTTYGAVRWAEDWQFLRDPVNRRAYADPFDALKYIPLDPSGSIYLTLSGEERLKQFFQNRPALGTVVGKSDTGRTLLRSIYGVDLHVGPHVRLYGELLNAAGGGFNYYGYSSGYRNDLELQQLFAEATGDVLGAKAGVLVGRMDFVDAPNYVLYLRTVSNVPQSWNGVRGYMIWPRYRIDLFDYVETNIGTQAVLDDRADYGTRLFGAYSSWALPAFRFLHRPSQVFFDQFFYGYIFRGASAAVTTITGSQAGSTTRYNPGFRLWGNAGPIEFSVGAIYQGGHFVRAATNAERTVQAYSISTRDGWRFDHVPTKPLVGIQSDLFSGGNNRSTTGTVGTYVTPFVPTSTYLDTTFYIGESNVIDVSPVYEGTLFRRTTLELKAPFFWRDSTNDAVYNFTPAAYAFPRFSGGYIGATPQALLRIGLDRHLLWENDFGRFFASSSFKRAGATNATYYLSDFDFDF